MTIRTFPSTVIPTRGQMKPTSSRVVVRSDFGNGPPYSNVLTRFRKRNWTLPLKMGVTGRNALEQFIAQVSPEDDKFWAFWLESHLHYDQYVGTVGPWDLPGVMTYDSSAGTYVDETDDAKNGVAGGIALHPAAGVNDEVVFILPRPCDKITVTIATPASAAGGTATIASWKYSKNDGTWAAITPTDGTTNFTAAAGAHDITLTIPTDWDTVAVNGAEGYALKAIFDAGTVPTAPTATRVTCNSLTFDIPGKTTSLQTIYDNGTALVAPADYSVVSGGGGGGSDRITTASYRTQGHILTADFTGFLRILGTIDDVWEPLTPNPFRFTGQVVISEVNVTT